MEQEIRRVQHELAQLEKLSLIGTLTSGLLHEVRNPLTALIAQTTLMKEDPRMPAGLTARLTIIEYSAQRAMEVVKNFLGFSRKDEGRRVAANVNDVIRKTIDLVAHECNNNKVSVETDLGKIPPTHMNVGEIQQVLLNLFKNAIDAVSQQGQRGAIMAASSLSVDGETVRVEVRDNGPGIPEKHRAKLFEPFYTTKPDSGGTGLGLSTCRRLIEMHGGKMGFTSSEGQGTTFWFEIPRNAETVNASTAPQLASAGFP
jgi:signal transduction histidine kinase